MTETLQTSCRTLDDGRDATFVVVAAGARLPKELVSYLLQEFNQELEKGESMGLAAVLGPGRELTLPAYPMYGPMTETEFRTYWFGHCAVLCLEGRTEGLDEAASAPGSWPARVLGTFYIKPNYPGRCSTVCNAGFLVPAARRRQGIGRQLAEAFLELAPRLGYRQSVFNLVFATNVPSIQLWEKLGFKRIGTVSGCAQLKNVPGYVDAYMYGYKFT